MRLFLTKQLKKLYENGLPFQYALSFVTEIEKDNFVSVEETNFFLGGDVMFVNLTIAKENCSTLEYDFQHRVYFKFPPDYPFSPPLINLEEFFFHDLIINNDQINTCDYGPYMEISQGIINVYLIICEALNDQRNANIVKDWNQYCKNKCEILK